MYHGGYKNSTPAKKVSVMLNNYFFAVLMRVFSTEVTASYF